MKSMKGSHLAENLASLRRSRGLSQEKVAEAVGVTRQAVAKWELGETAPDVLHSDALAALYDVSLDDLVHYDQKRAGIPAPPRGKHIFGTVQVGERGQIVIPKRARDLLGIRPGDALVVLGDTNPGTSGLALVQAEQFTGMLELAGRAMEQEEAGMRVKYQIAVALSHQAELLIFDEPTSGLDPVSRDELLTLFRAIAADGKRSILFSTHITSDLERCADDITYIKDGQLLSSAPKADFAAAFRHLRTPEDRGELTLEEIIVRTERRTFHV